MPSDETTEPTVEVVGPPILTVYFKNKRTEPDENGETQPLAGAQEVMDFSVNGGALIAQAIGGDLMIFPLGELEYASLTPQLATKEGEDVDGVSGSGEEDAGEGAQLIIPNFGGGSRGSSDDDGSDGASS